ncbi:MAG: hypothetical protein KDC87_13960 [Planctomycetes bacterium]|nr:hypothetical protein [Planctomycetota bacterium]
MLGVVEAFFGLVRVVLLGDTIDFIREEIDERRLRDHVRQLLERRFARDPEALAAAKAAIGVDHGAFGLRLDATAIRTYVTSDRRSNDDVPDLIAWHEDDALDIDIRQLAGYDHASFWKRGRPEVVGADEDEVDTYIADRGGRSFRIYPMSERLLRSKAGVAEERARDLGLMLRFEIAEREVTDPADVVLVGSSASQDRFNVAVLERSDETTPPDGAARARSELCVPAGGGVFGYQGSFIGYSSHLDDATCVDGDPFPGSRTSGVSFLDRVPDTIFRYVFVHELGHYFGLCHVSGANRIMFTANKDADLTWWSWGLLPEYLYLEGGPRFVLDEAKRAWDYIVAGFPTDCLTTRAH